MTNDLDYDVLDDALRRAGSSWDAAQAHGLLSGKLAVLGSAAGPGWLVAILGETDGTNALARECEDMLVTLLSATHRLLRERLSGFSPLLPGDAASMDLRTAALAHWSEAYLHGLVSAEHDESLRKRLAVEPVAGIIRDMLAITRATVDEHDDDQDEEAYAEIVEYLRVAAQLVYEELADLRTEATQ